MQGGLQPPYLDRLQSPHWEGARKALEGLALGPGLAGAPWGQLRRDPDLEGEDFVQSWLAGGQARTSKRPEPRSWEGITTSEGRELGSALLRLSMKSSGPVKQPGQ